MSCSHSLLHAGSGSHGLCLQSSSLCSVPYQNASASHCPAGTVPRTKSDYSPFISSGPVSSLGEVAPHSGFGTGRSRLSVTDGVFLVDGFPVCDSRSSSWSSLHTFSKFYRVHIFASADESLEQTSSFSRTDSLFVIPEGPRRGLAALKTSISRWIRMAIVEAYHVKNRAPSFRVTAHSARAVGASWAVHHGASALQAYLRCAFYPNWHKA
ncbi:uncharacterized protein LOC122944655 [Bufo gargarizans]|uniref:uncharacterized protein LOC122944655 n=1 Tax=Bufo gargarizans TaxID=30331 RepID=UPI001CF1B6EC|nr:uncharacterized protein LOC122944655 [Bufo gargarizans]